MRFNSKLLKINLLLIIICLISLTCVSASNNESEVYQMDCTDNSNLELNQADSQLSATVTHSEPKTATKSAYNQFVDDIKENRNIELKDDITITDTIYVSDCTINGNGHTIDGNNKQIFYAKGTVTIKNLVLKNGDSFHGGAIYSYAGSTLNLDHCTIMNSKATDGGAVYSTGKLNLNDCTFLNNNAIDHGGAVVTHSAYGTSKVTIKNCYFEGNVVKNTKEARGGAFYCYDNICEIIGCTFKNNHAYANPYSYGGAVYLHNKYHTISGCTFYGNTVKNHGGAILAYQSVQELTVKNCVFKRNEATKEDGGAISFGGKKINIYGCTFDSNYAYEDGGAMDVYSKGSYTIKVNINNCDFKSNSGRKTAGALYIGRKAKFNIKNSRFTKNKSTIGGAIFCEGYSATITNCVFNSNKATKMGNVKSKGGYKMNHCGGAIYNKHSTVKVTSSKFYNNKATYGGAIFNKATLKLYRSLMKGNIATLYGGGLFHDTGKLTLFKNSFLYNKGKYQGLYSRTDVPLKGNILKPKQKKIH